MFRTSELRLTVSEPSDYGPVVSVGRKKQIDRGRDVNEIHPDPVDNVRRKTYWQTGKNDAGNHKCI